VKLAGRRFGQRPSYSRGLITQTSSQTPEWQSFTVRIDPAQQSDAADIEELKTVFANQQKAFMADPYPSKEERIARLQGLAGAIMKHRDEMKEALQKDFVTHPENFADLSEVLGMVGRVGFAIEQIDKWMEPQERIANEAFWGSARTYMWPQPKGVIVNMPPWNYPYDIGMGPIIEMIAAGNRVVVKPSDLSKHTGEVYKKLVASAFPDTSNHGVRVAEVVTGGLELSKMCPTLPWNHLVYTGGPQGAKAVMRACAENLVPCTLELGGKCPVILHGSDYSVDQSVVDEIMAVKLVKNGQVCVGVDYVLLPEGSQDAFIDTATKSLAKMTPEGFTSDGNLVSIITDGHAERLAGLVIDAKSRCQKIVTYGESKGDVRRPPFTFIVNPSDDCKVMQEEIFGPVLPIKTYKNVDEALKYVQSRDRPLSISLFTKDEDLKKRALESTLSGGFNHNAGPCMHAAQQQLGFGGSGMSGMGRHHGYEGFMEFSNLKAVFERGEGGIALEGPAILSPPYNSESTEQVVNAVVQSIVGK